MNRTTHRSKYFCGNEISIRTRTRVSTLSKAFDAVLVNDITKLFYAEINGEYNEPEQENGQIDNTDEINDLNIKLSELTRTKEAAIKNTRRLKNTGNSQKYSNILSFPKAEQTLLKSTQMTRYIIYP